MGGDDQLDVLDVRTKVLVLGSFNSCRNQMALGWFNHLYPKLFDATAAAVVKSTDANSIAVRVMSEAGVDLQSLQARVQSDIPDLQSYLEDHRAVIALSDEACDYLERRQISCQIVKRLFPYPPHMTYLATSEEEVLDIFRGIRDEIWLFVKDLPYLLGLS
jgi:protein-tyrosine-phosphatase